MSLDQAANVILGGLPDETISSRLGRLAAKGSAIGRAGKAVLNWLQPEHVEKAIEHDKERGESVEVIEQNAEDSGV